MGILGSIGRGIKKATDPLGLGDLASDYIRGPGRAADAQYDASMRGYDLQEQGMTQQREMFDQSMATQKPWLQEGERHLRSLSNEVDSGSFDVDPFQFGDFSFDYEQSPGYQFAMDQGLQGVDRRASARGGRGSGGNDLDMMQFAQGLAAQDYGNQYNRAYGEYRDQYGMASDNYNRQVGQQTNRYNRRAGMAGVGQQAAGTTSNMQMRQGSNLANQYTGLAGAYMNIGNAQANQYMKAQNQLNPLINMGMQAAGAYAGGM